VIKQITRPANSVAANYKATKRAKSSADFLNKYRIVEEEADETIHFLEIIRVRRRDLEKECIELIKEYEAFISVAVSSIQTIRKNNSQLK
jgi:four helix bundle protein